TVTDIKGEPLIGVSILEKGTVNGAVTDIDGKFTLSVSAGAQIEVSCIGFTPKTLTVTSGTPLTIVLEEDSELLNEVVVTALGIKREQKALSYNVQEVKGDKLTAVKDANFINSLQGKVAGAIVNTSAAGPGAAARIIMRGTKSLEKDDNALYVIDGIPMFNINSGDNSGGTMNDQPGTNSVADINPEDIESLTILTGPSAAALYGSEAANGVILITTKKGSEGKMKVSYSNSTSFSTPLMMPQFQTRYANAEGSQYSWGPALSTPSTYNPADFFNTGVNEINGLTFTCGTEKNQTYASVSTTNSTGILPNNTYNRYNFSFRNTTKFAKDKLTLDVGGQYIIQNNKNMVGSGLYFNPLTSLYLFPRGESFQEVQAFERWNETRGIMEQYWPEAIFGSDYDMQNPYWIMYRMQNKLKKRRYMMNASLKWDVTQWLNIAARIRVDNSDQDIYAERYATTTGTFTEGSDRGFYNHTKQNDRTVYGDVIASISKNFVDDRLSINANIGASFNDMREDVM
ncbi:MAG: SusC/RagA family TonB-linked outer membrane protein, partial [Bacteroidales bacterium]|nr:SusC/RagA family TonB-linked outer membrane protein [Bacteroidales bacterium]